MAVQKNETSKRRSCRKPHIGIAAGHDEIVAFDPTDKEIHDAFHAGPSPEQVADAPASFMGDGAYDRAHVRDTVRVRNPAAGFIVSPCKVVGLGSTATISPAQRDLSIRSHDEHGRMNWRKTSGDNRRSQVEAAIGRSKRVIGDALRHGKKPYFQVRRSRRYRRDEPERRAGLQDDRRRSERLERSRVADHRSFCPRLKLTAMGGACGR